jgi:vancomycin resistance protein YoaR
MEQLMSPSSHRHSALVLGLGGLLTVAGAGLLVGYLLGVQDAAAGDAAGERGELPDTAAELDEVREQTKAFLARPLKVELGKRPVELAWSDLGAAIDEESVELARLDASGQLAGAVPVTVDSERVRAVLSDLKSELDRPARNAWLDLEGRKVIPATEGVVVDLYGSAEVIEAAARTGASEVELVATRVPAEITDLGIDDISTVLATFTTKYKVSDSRRNDNLKLLASRLDGFVMKPGELFSFNEVSGGRSEKEGYKMAHVITAGEMVDGMAGGACQISTTLHGAAFFAGLELVNTIPHSRPSTYVPLGLDATVVYPTVDLKLRNSHEFPVAVHFKVARGEATVEILGKEKPFDEVKFERFVQKKTPFETITREDNTIAVGHMVVDQKGEYGFKLKRFRKIYRDGKVVKKNTWNLDYKPVIEYVRMGTNPDPNLPPPKPKRGH